MDFGYIMLLAILITPLLMIGYGLLFIKNPPKRINSLYGYTTKRSMRNQDTWAFAHHYFGRLSLVCGLVIIPISIVPIVLVLGKSEQVIRVTGIIVLSLQVIIMMLATIIPTERALKNNFDEFGNPRFY